MCISENDQSGIIQSVLNGESPFALILGDCLRILDLFPDDSVNCVITSPPYWKMREYNVTDAEAQFLIGTEDDPQDYVKHLVEVFRKMKRILKRDGSLWLNIGDKYHNKNLMGMPWRVALALQDEKWILRNDVIWEKLKGTQSTKDRLRDVYEHFFHFVKSKRYFYDIDKILIKHKNSMTVKNGRVISATGVSGVKYRRQIMNSPHLTESERKAALAALDGTLGQLRRGEIVDFRMTVRGVQRTLHSNSTHISGRAKELEQKGFFIIKSHSKGYAPSDIWRIVPEDKWRKDAHYAVFPIELLERPIRATCPDNGIILDPFMGTGSTVEAALSFGKRAIGIDISKEYYEVAEERLRLQQLQLIC